MYVDYIDFNKACPKDNFPLPRSPKSTNWLTLLSIMNSLTFMDVFFLCYN